MSTVSERSDLLCPDVRELENKSGTRTVWSFIGTGGSSNLLPSTLSVQMNGTWVGSTNSEIGKAGYGLLDKINFKGLKFL